MSVPVLLLTPPFTQLNTPYPATAYLKGFLSTKGIRSFQADLGIEVTLALFKPSTLTRVFERIAPSGNWSENARRILQLQDRYIDTVAAVIQFLQGKNPTLAHRIAQRNFLPEAARFAQLDNLNLAFGSMGIQDRAKHLATLYLEDLSDLFQECLDPHFGFSRYAERLARSANSFDDLYEALLAPPSLIDELLFEILEAKLQRLQPKLVALSVPFPGNLFSGLRCGQYIKQHHPDIRVAMGGGYPNTELRSLAEPRVFDFLDFVTIDDGEAPLENILHHLHGHLAIPELKRTFIRQQDQVIFVNNAQCQDYRQGEVGTPDYDDLLLNDYIGAIEITNPMHSLWSDGRWNKLTMAHGCYWGKCTFCDISLPYIANYEPISASLLADRMQEMMDKTGTSGFHFVDEATPPALMRALALELISRKMVLSWWANIRFEKAFTRDLCQLLKASGCIAISGGLEVASDRLLARIKKGITVSQVARVNKHFMEAGIMVHAYLMYGFPTQTAQETIDSLEMVRQMFQAGILQSAYWHQFAMTAHAPIGLNPEAFGVEKEDAGVGLFANNDLIHRDPTGADHESFSFGLRKSLINYMNGIGFEKPVQQWFEHKCPKTTIAPDFIVNELVEAEFASTKPNAKLVFLGTLPKLEQITKSKKGASWELAALSFETIQRTIAIKLPLQQGEWLFGILQELVGGKSMTMAALKDRYQQAGLEDFELFWDNKPMDSAWRFGLLVL
ncbi:MAG: radical SAM protein [Bacteroidetes bacterium]|nr:radical SAM protein [Bacteroidota bacterium]